MTADYSHEPQLVSTVAIDGSSIRYPVRRIFCVGRNYADHAREMGSDPEREPPFFFTKFPDSVVPSGSLLTYPLGTANYHYEMELVVALKDPCLRIDAPRALEAVYGYACGLDMTRRDLQQEAKDKGRPWDLGKSFEQAAVLAPIVEASRIPEIATSALTLAMNGITRQSANIADMIWSSAEIISVLSGYYVLGPGDLIFTGTPAGVGPVVPGDELRGDIDGLPSLLATIGEATPQE